MPRIIANIWLDNEAEQAAEFYASILPKTRITATTRYPEAGQEIHGGKPGSVLTVDLEIDGFGMILLNGGPHFRPNPSISFFCHCGTVAEIDRLWAALAPGGTTHMELGQYPWSERYGWISDRYGVSWQIILDPDASERIVPSLLFVGEKCGQAEEAMRFYTTVFNDAAVGEIFRYGPDQEPEREGTVMYGPFRLEGQSFVAADSAADHEFGFSEGVSLVVDANTQEQIDFYWDRLSAVPESEQCGWLKDRFGVSWQIFPVTEMNELLSHPDHAAVNRTMEAMLAMKKIDLTALRAAAAGR
ncbi:MAG: VOC family protein [Spirochaetaceae bacterium]|nr:MAG: VOC family protein [Spirochaetaceae bacterium]